MVHKKILRDNFYGISRNKVCIFLEKSIDPNLWYDCCNFLKKKISKKIYVMLIDSISSQNNQSINKFMEENNIDNMYDLKFVSKNCLKNLVIEIVQHYIDNKIIIKEELLEKFNLILNFLIIKYVLEFIDSLNIH